MLVAFAVEITLYIARNFRADGISTKRRETRERKSMPKAIKALERKLRQEAKALESESAKTSEQKKNE